ncbi:MAG TPA: hypothetical protein VGF48_04855 [Thermoanaerobaculia bacterium]|jgi:hypothetical protein
MKQRKWSLAKDLREPAREREKDARERAKNARERIAIATTTEPGRQKLKET